VSAPAEHQDEYHDAMIGMLELIWGQGFLIPAGPENVRRTVAGLDLRDKLVLDIGSGIGGPALVLAGEMGARVVGIDLEGPLVARARAYADAAGLGGRAEFRQVAVGPLALDDGTFDVVYSSGVFTQVEDKLAMFKEAFRVLKPGGVFTCYDWMKGDRPYSDDMRTWFKLEGLTYAMETLEAHGRILRQAGFTDVELEDDQQAYRDLCHREYNQMQGPLKAQMIAMLGREQQEHFLENWRAMVVLDKGELRPGFYRARKPA
jgi:ubiquinone/menaquinone biosynthesis C-methylase UbiE